MKPVQREFYIFCEGFHDRAFWSGMLTTRNWEEAYNKSKRIRAKDPRDRTVEGGRYAFYQDFGDFREYAEVIPVDGESKILSTADNRLKDVKSYVENSQKSPNSAPSTEPKYIAVLSVDDDTTVESGATLPTLSVQHAKTALESLDSQLVVENDVFYLFSRSCAVHITRWKAGAEEIRGVPAKQTLERLVCAAICEAYAARSEDVEAWLQDKQPSPKSYAWAYMAGWYSEHGCDDFYREIWRDEVLRPILERQLKAIGAWAIFDSLSHRAA